MKKISMGREEYREQVKRDLRKHETAKRIRRASNLGMIAGAGAASYGHFINSNKIKYPAAAIAILSGIAKGRAIGEEKASLNRIKRFYDIREKGQESGNPYAMKKSAGYVQDLAKTIANKIPGAKKFPWGTAVAIPAAVTSFAMGDLLHGAMALGFMGGDFMSIKTLADAGIDSVGRVTGAQLKHNLQIPMNETDHKSMLLAEQGRKMEEKLKNMRMSDLNFQNPTINSFLNKNPKIKNILKKLKDTKADLYENFYYAKGKGNVGGKNLADAVTGPLSVIHKYDKELSSQIVNSFSDGTWTESLGDIKKQQMERFAPAVNAMKADLNRAISRHPGLEGTGGDALEKLDKIIQKAVKTDGNSLRQYTEKADRISANLSSVQKNLNDAIGHHPGLRGALGGSGAGAEKFVGKTLKSDAKNLVELSKKINSTSYNMSRAVDISNKIVDEIPFARKGMRLFGTESGQFAKNFFESNGANVVKTLEKIPEYIRRTKGSAVFGAGTLGLALAGQAIAKYKTKHPLAKDEMVTEILTGESHAPGLKPEKKPTLKVV